MKKMKVSCLSGWLAVVFLLSTGCVKMWQKKLDLKTYMLEAARSDAVCETPLSEKLWIERVTVLPPYDARSLVMRNNDVEFTASYYSELLLSPSDNFRNSFYSWFSESGIFQDVSLSSRKGTSNRLSVSVLEFYGDKGTQEAVLRIKVLFFDEKEKQVFFLKIYEERDAFENATAEDLMRSYGAALTRILTQCEADVLTVLKENGGMNE